MMRYVALFLAFMWLFGFVWSSLVRRNTVTKAVFDAGEFVAASVLVLMVLLGFVAIVFLFYSLW